MGPKVKIDRRSCRGMRIFDPPKGSSNYIVQYRVEPSEQMLEAAKRAVLGEIDRQEKLSKAGKSALEKAFYLSSGEKCLIFKYDMMQELVQRAKIINFRGEDKKDMGYNDPNRVLCARVNRLKKMRLSDVKMTLMHEALHQTV